MPGESGAFLDPLYSPGTDFIAMNNSWLSDLILRDLDGEDIEIRVSVFEQSHLALVDSWIPVYQNKYLLRGNTQIMVIKIFWDWATYWAVPAHLFANKALVNLRILKDLFAKDDYLGRKFGRLNNIMQDLFLEWLPFETATFSNRYIDPFDLAFLRKFQEEIEVQREPAELMEQIAINMNILEQLAVAIFRKVSTQVNGTAAGIKVNPYTINLGKKENTMMLDTESEHVIEPGADICMDVDVMWFYPKVEPLLS